MNKNKFRFFGALVAASTALALSGCAPQSDEVVEAKPSIVATTNVWADITSQIAGDFFEVIALISDPAIDPHSYEATARDQLAIEEADLFVMNGGGYDEFAEVLAGTAGTEVFNVYEIHEAAEGAESGKAHSEGEAHTEGEAHAGEEAHAEGEVHTEGEAHAEGEVHSEGEAHSDEDAHEAHGDHDGSDHTWYDLHLVEYISGMIAIKLGELQPENAASFTANAEAFGAEIELLEVKRDALANSEIHYFEAHPLAALLFKDLGFENLTPEGFAESEEAGLEPSVAVLADSRELIPSGKIQFIAVNQQATSPTLDALKQLAADAEVPVLEFDELLPAGSNYQEWMAGILDSIAAIK